MGWFTPTTLQPGHPQGAQQQLRPISPSPHPVKKDANIIFLDVSNVTMSRVGADYMSLLREWTTRTENRWPVHHIHSAGLGVKSRSDCTDVLESLKPPLKMIQGNQKPNETAMAALFDNKLFNYPYKDEIKNMALKQTSRGITQNMFKTYDYILVFTGRDYETVIRIKEALTTKGGQSLVPRRKCRVVHLGSYLGEDGKTVQITPPAPKADGTTDRVKFNKTVSLIKLSTKTFLKNELGWVQPPKGAAG
jgi:hypothetical protein